MDPFGDYNSGITFDPSQPTPNRASPSPSPPPHRAPSRDDARNRSHSHPNHPVKPSSKTVTRDPSPVSDTATRSNQSSQSTKPTKPHAIVEPPVPVLFQGILEKKIGLSLFPSYHARYFILSPHEIWYYNDESEFNAKMPPRRKIPFERSSYLMDEGSSGNKLSIISHGKTTIVRASTPEELSEWKKRITECLQNAHSDTAFQR